MKAASIAEPIRKKNTSQNGGADRLNVRYISLVAHVKSTKPMKTNRRLPPYSNTRSVVPSSGLRPTIELNLTSRTYSAQSQEGIAIATAAIAAPMTVASSDGP